MWRHNMVAISKVGNFRTRLSLSEILSDLIRCRPVRYPWFCSVRPRSWWHLPFWNMWIRIEVNFPLKWSVHLIFVPRSGMFFRFVVKFNVLADFCESCKKSGVMSKVYAFDSACFYCCATLGTIGFSRVRGEFSVLAEGRHIFARVTKKTWQKPETALEKSLAPRVLLCRISEKSASGICIRNALSIIDNNVGHSWLMSSSRCWDGRWCP